MFISDVIKLTYGFEMWTKSRDLKNVADKSYYRYGPN